MGTFRAGLIGVLAAAALAACGGQDAPVVAQAGSGTPGPTARATPASPAATTYDCYGVVGTAEELTEGPTLDSYTDHAGYETFVQNAQGQPSEWVVVESSDDRLAGVRELPEPERMDDQLRTHERLVVELIPAESLPNADRDTWMMSSAGACSLQARLESLGSADLALDPASLPDPKDQSVDLLVTESACASGEPATGRVEVVNVEMTAEEVRVVIGVEPNQGGQDCPSNPATPVTVDLPEPIGDRVVVDAAVYPPKRVTPADRS